MLEVPEPALAGPAQDIGDREPGGILGTSRLQVGILGQRFRDLDGPSGVDRGGRRVQVADGQSLRGADPVPRTIGSTSDRAMDRSYRASIMAS